MQIERIFVIWSCIRIKCQVSCISVCPNSFPTDCSKVVPLLQFFVVCALVVLYLGNCIEICHLGR